MTARDEGVAERRRALLRWTTPFAIVCAISGVKLLAMTGAADVARTSVAVGNPDGAVRVAATLSVANVVERWKAPFAAGTAAAAAAQDVHGLEEAEASLRTALSLAQDVDECPVRYNLALVVEARADATASDLVAAEALYREAQEIADAAPTACADVPSLTRGPGEDPAEDGSGASEGGEGEGGSDGDGSGDGSGSAAEDLAAAAARNAGKAEGTSATRAAAEAQAAADEATPSAPGTAAAADRQAELDARVAEAQAREESRRSEEVTEGADGPVVATPW